MNVKEIIDGNIVIADFMGFTKQTNPDERWLGMYEHVRLGNVYYGFTKPEHLRFYGSWDWLMPVIGKISESCEEPEELDNLKYALLCNDIETAWKFVVDYLNMKK